MKIPTENELLPRPLWQGLVLYRAGYECQGEGPHLGRLHAHHADRDKSNHRLDNGICLCNACHTRERRKTELALEQRLIEERAKGRSLRDIGREFGVSHQTVRRLTTKIKAPKEGWSLVDDDSLAEMIRLRSEGKTYREIGDHFGISQPTVIRYIKKGSVRPRPSGRPSKGR